MATVRISEAEAAKVRAGEEAVEKVSSPHPILKAASPRQPGRLLSEALRMARERGFTGTLDGDFERDLNDAINSHPEPLDVSWD